LRTESVEDLCLRPYRRLGGGLVVLGVLAVIVGMVLTFGLAWVRPGISTFRIVRRAPYQSAPGPLTTLLQGRPPGSSNAHPVPPTPSIKAVEILGRSVDLVVAGRIIRTIPTARLVNSLDAVVALVDNSTLLARTDGTITLRVGVVIGEGADIAVAAPATTRIVMDDKPSVMVAFRTEDD
jgi:hypothetical protein